MYVDLQGANKSFVVHNAHEILEMVIGLGSAMILSLRRDKLDKLKRNTSLESLTKMVDKP